MKKTSLKKTKPSYKVSKEAEEMLKHNGMKFFDDEKFEKTDNPFGDLLKEHLTKQIILLAVIVVLIIFLFMNLDKIGAFLNKLVEILAPIILGWVFTFIMSPLYNIVTDKLSNSQDKRLSKFSNVIATIVCTVIVIGLSIGLVFLFVPQLYNSISSFLSRVGGYLAGIRGTIENVKSNSENNTTQQLMQQLEKSIAGIMENTNNINYSAIASSLFTGFAVSFKALLNYFVGLVVMIYSLNMKEELCMGLKRVLFALTRKDIAKKILIEVRFAKQVFSGFFVGKLLDSLIIGIICYICCLLMKMPYTPLISVIVGITNIIPFFGPFIGAIPSFLLIFLEEPFSWRPWGFLVFILILQQVDGNIIGPKILGDKTGVGSFWVLFSILLFGGLFGFVGMIVAVPLWAVITRLFDEFVTTKLVDKEYPLTSDDYKRLKEYNSNLRKGN